MSGFKVPTDEQIQEALRRIPTFQLRRVFFEALANPEWIKPLQKAGAFASPPEPVIDEKGMIREAYWPEIDYLIRMADVAPGPVVDVLLSLQGSKNSWVRRGTFEIGAKIPAEQAALLKPLVEAWKGEFGWRTDAHDLAGMARNLLLGGKKAFGRSFANMLFRPEPAREEHGDPVTAMEEYWYDQELPSVVEALGDDGLTVVIPWLEQWERANRRYSETSDITNLGRADIAQRGESYHDVEQSLIDAVRDLAVTAFASDPASAAKQFLGRPMTILRKISLYSATKALADFPGDEDQQPLLAASESLLADPLSSNHGSRVEFADLYLALREREAPVEDLLRQVIAAGPYASRERLLEMLARRKNQEKSPEELAVEETDYWQQRLLATIGIDQLPSDLAKLLNDLDERNGPIGSPREPDVIFTSWSGSAGPITLEELGDMTPPDLAAYLESWRAGDAWMGPTHEGMARVLTELITSKPDALTGIGDLTTHLRPSYLRAILTGWIARLRDGGTIDWDQVLALVEAVLTHSDESDIPAEGQEFDDDHDFASAKQAAVNLLTDMAKPSETRGVPEATMEAVARLLIGAFSDGTAWGRYAARETSDGTDPLTISLNWQWPIMLRGLIHLASHGTQTPWFADTMRTLETEISRDDQLGAAYAIIGEGFGRLYNHAPDWLNDHLVELFGTETSISRAQQIALTTTLATHRTHPKLLELLRGPLMAAMQLDEAIVMGWKGQSDALQLIGHWIITCIIWGEIDQQDPLAARFFSVVDPDIRGAAIGHMAWSFMHSEKVDLEIRARLEALWDARVAHVRGVPEDSAELKDFYWFARSEKFAPAWWLPRIREAAELNKTLNTRGLIGEQLAGAALAMPREAFDALKILIDREDESGTSSYDLSEHAVPTVLAVALDSGDANLEKEAWKFLNDLGARGYVNMEERVNKLRGV